MKKWISFSVSILSITAFLFAYQNCGKSYQAGSSTLLSTDSDGVSPTEQTPAPTCTARSPLKNQLQNLDSVVDRVSILEDFPLSPTAPTVCTLQNLPDTVFRPPLRTSANFRAYMEAWIDHAGYIMAAADLHLRLPSTNMRKAELANCVLDHLYQIATRNLFAEPRDSYADNQGEYERVHMLGSFNVSFNKISREASLPTDRLGVVRTWLGTSGMIVMDKFNRHIAGGPQFVTHTVFRAGVTLMVAGRSAAIPALYNRGVEFIQMGLDQVQPNGTIPIELDGGAESFRRHVFSLQAFLFAAQIAKLNNLDLFSYGNNAIGRLARLTINSFKNFSEFQSLTTTTQTYLPTQFITMAKWDLSWMEIYFSHTGDVDLVPYLTTLRPLGNHHMGRVTFNYGLACLAASP